MFRLRVVYYSKAKYRFAFAGSSNLVRIALHRFPLVVAKPVHSKSTVMLGRYRMGKLGLSHIDSGLRFMRQLC